MNLAFRGEGGPVSPSPPHPPPHPSPPSRTGTRIVCVLLLIGAEGFLCWGGDGEGRLSGWG